MFEACQFIASLSATLFAGAAIYINVAEHWFIAALLIGSVVPITFFVIMPTKFTWTLPMSKSADNGVARASRLIGGPS